MPDPAVRFSGATLEYHGRRIWTDMSLAFEGASFVAILGPNGSGKTSLLRVILGLDAADLRPGPGTGPCPAAW